MFWLRRKDALAVFTCDSWLIHSRFVLWDVMAERRPSAERVQRGLRIVSGTRLASSRNDCKMQVREVLGSGWFSRVGIVATGS